MKITAKRIFKYSIEFIVLGAIILIVLSKIPATSLFYECKQDAQSPLFGITDSNIPNDQKFCQTGFHPEVKENLGALNTDIANGLILIGGFVTLPAGIVLLSRQFHSRPHPKNRNV